MKPKQPINNFDLVWSDRAINGSPPGVWMGDDDIPPVLAAVLVGLVRPRKPREVCETRPHQNERDAA